jgi:hypothetical protein
MNFRHKFLVTITFPITGTIKRMMKMKSWKKSAIVFTLATGLLVTGTSLTIVDTSHAASNSKVVVPVHQQTIKNIKKLAFQGKTVNSENFSLQS